MGATKVRSGRVGRALRLLVLLAAAGGAASCIDEVAEPAFLPEPGGELFLRYVSLGNSITAGFQSGGIHALFQNDAYPVLLAGKAGATFGVPALNFPGCPPPFAAPLSTERISTTPCSDIDRPPLVQNLAVPGHRMADALDPDGPGAGPLANLILGGLTQVEAMRRAEPTLVSLWLGNNDALGAALFGDTTRLTPLSDFQLALDGVVTAIGETSALDAILIGVVDPIRIAPALQPGAYFWLVEQSGEAPVPLAVADNCAPGTQGGARPVSFLVASAYLDGQTDSVRVDCGPEAAFVLNAAEVAAVMTRIGAFNDAIRSAAESRGWIYVDPTAAFIEPALAEPDLVRKCQGLATATTPETLRAAVEQTCPHPTAPNFFGAYLSFDGVHPSSAAHAVIADTLAGRLNARHGLALPAGS
ncbi:MAG TPA: SGNH/GDSL hydrolase family protein [Longimicrobiales bacterium]|nr:SGNH/GDSL hydrolase family protein [Longimicrobiales bacterium]